MSGQSTELVTGTAAPDRLTTNVSSDFAPRTVGFQAKADAGRDDLSGGRRAGHHVELARQVADRAALHVLAPFAVEPGCAVGGLPPARSTSTHLQPGLVAVIMAASTAQAAWCRAALFRIGGARGRGPGARDVQAAAHPDHPASTSAR